MQLTGADRTSESVNGFNRVDRLELEEFTCVLGEKYHPIARYSAVTFSFFK